MGIALPFRKKAGTEAQLEKARAALDATAARLAELKEQRKNLLLSSDDNSVIETLDRTIDDIKRTERTQADRLQLLQEQAAKEEVAKVAKRRAEHLDRLAATLSEADAVADEIEHSIGALVLRIDRLVNLRESVGAAWNFDLSQTEVAALGGQPIRKLLAFEFYRKSAKPFGGGISLPGATCPDLSFTHQPDKIKPLAEVLRDASAYAASIMRGEK